MSIELTVTFEGRTIDRYEFDSNKRIVIGRHEDCDVRLEQQGISRRHCEITLSGDAHLLRDLSSSNGTYVRGAKIGKHSLSDGDVFSLVGVKIHYKGAPKQVKVSSEDAVGLPDMTIRINPRKVGKAPSHGAARVSRITGHMLIEEGKVTHSVLLQQSTFLIGKSSKADVQIEGFLAPRMAAAIVRGPAAFWLIDLSPKGNCVTVNGQKVRTHELLNADVIKIYGKLRMQYYVGLPRMPEVAPSVGGFGGAGGLKTTRQIDATQLRELLEEKKSQSSDGED